MAAGNSAPTIPGEDTTLRAADGAPVPFTRWPLGAPPRARLLVVHGRGEHGRRYAPVAADLAARGIECAAIDLRGFGRTVGAGCPPGRCRDFTEYFADIDAGIATFEGQPAAPLYLLGHSAGGLVAVRWVEERGAAAEKALRGLVLSSPFLGMKNPVPFLKMLIVRAIGAFAPDKPLPASGTPNTRDEAIWKAYLEDPLTVRAPTARWFLEILKHQPLALDRADRVKLPVLVLQAGADSASDPAVSRRFAESCGAAATGGAVYKEYPGLLHEVLNELPEDRRRVLDDLAAWISAVSA